MREKQIEELAQVIAHSCIDLVESSCGEGECCVSCLATKLHKEGVIIQKWIPVTERLPEESGLFLVYTARGVVMEMDYSAKYKQFNMYDDGIGTPIACTHWMYMPEPPKGE
jgi:hypothetical protein